jgi:hypothetical protein
MIRSSMLAVVASLVLGLAASAQAHDVALKGRYIATTLGSTTDGARYVTAALSLTPRRGVVIDDVTGARREVACTVGATRAGLALGECGDDGTQSVIDLRTLVATPIAGLQAGERVEDVGRTWLTAAGNDPVTGKARPFLLRRADGTRIPSPVSVSRWDELDLDAAQLRLRPRLLGTTVLDRPDARSVTGVRSLPRLALRTGGRTIVVRSHCRQEGCEDIQYASGILSWNEGQAPCAFVVRTQRIGCWTPTGPQWHLMATSAIPSTWAVSHTARRLYVSAWARTDADPSDFGGGQQVLFRIDLAPLRRP